MAQSDLDNIAYNKFANGEITLAEYLKYQNRDKIMDLYEQKYKDALERARALHDLFITQGHDGKAEILEGIFPELKESEDEKMKKAIKHVLYENYSDAAVIEGVEIAEIVAWLEKCGEQTHAELGQSEVTNTLDPDKVIEWLEDNQPFVWVVDKFKKILNYDTRRKEK